MALGVLSFSSFYMLEWGEVGRRAESKKHSWTCHISEQLVPDERSSPVLQGAELCPAGKHS